MYLYHVLKIIIVVDKLISKFFYWVWWILH